MNKVLGWVFGIALAIILIGVVLKIVQILLPVALLLACGIIIYNFVTNKTGGGNDSSSSSSDKIYIDKDKK